ncbi:ileal sodium/bile acid cotransporter-like [Ptychodera flava]|uniref:ileal sodium/bile acid cotransporter-like n=1 Tax=Ptychodera flava TaxID=63121 RepID=UPI003969CF15
MVAYEGIRFISALLLSSSMVSLTASQQYDLIGNTTVSALTTQPKLMRSLSPLPPLTLVAGDTTVVKFNYSGILEEGLVLEVMIRDPLVIGFLGSNYSKMEFPLEQYIFDSIEVDLEAHAIGITAIETKIIFTGASTRLGMEVAVPLEPYAVKVLRPYMELSKAYNYVLLPLIVCNNIALGSAADVKVMWSKIKNPLHMTVGAFCQFVLMPLMTFGLAFLFQLDPYTAIGLLTVGCVPGDRLSTILTSLIGADLELSITMTIIFAVIALGMTPLNMFIYSRPFVNRSNLPIHVVIPFFEMFLQILALVVPISVGLLISWKVECLKKALKKILKLLSLTCLIATLILNMLTNKYVFSAPPNLILCAFLVPFLGFNLAYLIARIVRVSYIPGKTIGVETGIQNNILATAILRHSYPQPEADLLSRVSILAIVASIVDGLVWVIVHNIRSCINNQLKKRRAKKKQRGDADDDADPKTAPMAPGEDTDSDEDFYTVSDIEEDAANYNAHATKKPDQWYKKDKEQEVTDMRESNV